MARERAFAGPTGLGTAGTRFGRPAEPGYRDPGGPAEPRFDLPYPSRISPDAERARLEGLRWARAMCMRTSSRA